MYPEASVFHSGGWLRVLQRTYGYELFYLLDETDPDLPCALPIVEVRSRLTGVRGVSLPFTDLCSPLGTASPALGPIVHSLLAFGRSRGWTHFELRGGVSLHPLAAPSITYTANRLDLRPGPTRLRESFAKSAQRALAKAEAHGVRVEIAASDEALQTYCQLHALTRRRQGAPPQPPDFFHYLYEEFVAQEQGFVVLGYAAATPIAAAVFLHHGKAAVYKFGASDVSHQQMRGEFAVMAHALTHLADRGFHELHLGRSSAGQDGMRRFKMLWGGVEEPLHYYRLCVHSGRSLAAPDRTEGFRPQEYSPSVRPASPTSRVNFEHYQYRVDP